MKLVEIAMLAALIPGVASCVGDAGAEPEQTATTQQDSIVVTGTTPTYFGVTSQTPVLWTTASPMWSTTANSLQFVMRRGDDDPLTGAQANAHVFVFANGNTFLYCYKVNMSDLPTFLSYLNYYATYESGGSWSVKFWGIEGNVYIGRPPPPPPWPGGDQYTAAYVSHMQGLAGQSFNAAAAVTAIVD